MGVFCGSYRLRPGSGRNGKAHGGYAEHSLMRKKANNGQAARPYCRYRRRSGRTIARTGDRPPGHYSLPGSSPRRIVRSGVVPRARRVVTTRLCYDGIHESTDKSFSGDIRPLFYFFNIHGFSDNIFLFGFGFLGRVSCLVSCKFNDFN